MGYIASFELLSPLTHSEARARVGGHLLQPVVILLAVRATGPVVVVFASEDPSQQLAHFWGHYLQRRCS